MSSNAGGDDGAMGLSLLAADQNMRPAAEAGRGEARGVGSRPVVGGQGHSNHAVGVGLRGTQG